MTRPTVLIVDDDANLRRMLQLMLEGFGNRTLVAGDAEAALELLGRDRKSTRLNSSH